MELCKALIWPRPALRHSRPCSQGKLQAELQHHQSFRLPAVHCLSCAQMAHDKTVVDTWAIGLMYVCLPHTLPEWIYTHDLV